MNIFQAIILGIVEGITEFLPISSTFHLMWTSKLLGLEQTEFIKLFEVFIQGGAILAVVFLYWREILRDFELFKKLIISFIPTAIVGLIFYKLIKGVFLGSYIPTTFVFIVVGIIFIIVEMMIQKGTISLKKDAKQLDYRGAVLIGLFQSLAVVPGVSRAGAVLLGMMIFGYKRDESAKYSFMLSIPTILAASLFDIIKMRGVLTQGGSPIFLLFIGFMIAFVSAYFIVKWLISFLQKNSLVLFGWYRILIGIMLLLAFVV